MNEDRRLFPKVLKLLTKGFLFSFSLGIIFWIVMIFGFLTWNPPIRTETEQIIIEDLKLNGIILSFSLALFVFIVGHLESKFYEWALSLAVATFTSFFLSIFFGFISLLSSFQPNQFFPLLPISFALTGIIIDVSFLLYSVFKFKQSKKK